MGERTGKTILTTQMLGKWYYRDFAQLFQELFYKNRYFNTVVANNESEDSNLDANESDLTQSTQMKLVFLKPASCDPAIFLDKEQKLYMNLYDKLGKSVVIEVIYSKKEAEGIRYLEKITNNNLPYFFGKVYLRDGKIRMYPITAFKKGELQEI